MEDSGNKTIDTGDKTEETVEADGALPKVVKESVSDSAESVPVDKSEESEPAKAPIESTEVDLVCNENEQPADSAQINSEVAAVVPSAEVVQNSVSDSPDPVPKELSKESESAKAQMETAEVDMVCMENDEQSADSAQINSEVAAVVPSAEVVQNSVSDSLEPVPKEISKESESAKAQMETAEVDMVCMESEEQSADSAQINRVVEAAVPPAVNLQTSETPQATIIKDEPTDAEMEAAEDFTGKSSDFPTVPRITIKQEVPTSIHEQVAAERAVESTAVLQINSSSLSLLCQYISSDSESNITDSDDEAPTNGTTANNKRKASTSSAESLSDDAVEIIPNTNSYRVQDAPILVSDAETTATGMDESSDDALSADEEDVPHRRPPIKSKGEVLISELPPIEDLQISVPETECKPIGHVESIVAQIVIVQSYAGVELLNLETVLFLDKGKRALGKIFDVIGQVTAPMYCVLFNSRNDVIRKGITVGMPVYCAPQTEHTSFIILSDLMKHKGSDASWLDDNEAPVHALDYSDDEQERSARRRRGSCSSSGRGSPEAQYQPYHLPSQHPHRPRGYGRGGGYRGRGRGYGHSWHTNLPHQMPQMQPPQRVLNPFAFVAGVPPPPPPPPAPPGGSN